MALTSTPSSAEVRERVELYLYPPSGTSWPLLGWNLLLLYLHTFGRNFFYVMSDFSHEEDVFFSDATQRVVVIPSQRFGTNYRVQSSRVKNQKGTLVWNYHNSLRNKPKERSYHHLKQFLISFLLLLIFLISVFWYRLCDKRPHLTPWKPVNNTPKLEEIKWRGKERKWQKKLNLPLVAARTC